MINLSTHTLQFETHMVKAKNGIVLYKLTMPKHSTYLHTHSMQKCQEQKQVFACPSLPLSLSQAAACRGLNLPAEKQHGSKDPSFN